MSWSNKLRIKCCLHRGHSTVLTITRLEIKFYSRLSFRRIGSYTISLLSLSLSTLGASKTQKLYFFLIQLSFGRSFFPFPCGVTKMVIVAFLVSMLSSFPNHWHLLHLMTMLIYFPISALRLTLSFVTLCGR